MPDASTGVGDLGGDAFPARAAGAASSRDERPDVSARSLEGSSGRCALVRPVTATAATPTIARAPAITAARRVTGASGSTAGRSFAGNGPPSSGSDPTVHRDAAGGAHAPRAWRPHPHR